MKNNALQLLKTLFSFPLKIVKNFNKRHLKTLLYAMQHEPFHVILYNLKKLIAQTDELQQYRIRDHQKGICVEVERIRFFQGKLEIKGWCATKAKRQNFRVITDQDVKINPILDLYRPDVKTHLPNYLYSEQSGFFIVANIKGTTQKVTLDIGLANNENQVIEIQVEEDNWVKQYQQFLKKKVPKKIAKLTTTKVDLAKIVYEQNNLTANQLNQKIERSTADYLLLIPTHAELSPNAINVFQKAIFDNPTANLIYSDEIRLNEKGEAIPYFKSDFNKDLLLSTNYIGNSFLVKKETGEKIGWFDSNLKKGFLYDFLLKLMDKKGQILHLPNALIQYQEKEILQKEVEASVLKSHFDRKNIKVSIEEKLFRVKRKCIDNQLVSIIIPFKDNVDLLKACIKSILEKTTYENFEILLIDNNSEAKEMANYLETISQKYDFIKVYTFQEPFNFSKINNWATQFAKGDLLLFLNNDTEVISRGWLTEMVSHIQRKEVGAVGAKLLYPDNTIQHAGIILGIFGVAEHSHKYYHDSSEGYFNRPNLTQNVTAVTAACLMTKKSIFREVGGFDEKVFPITLNDVDFCLKIRAKGQLIVYTPYGKLYHYESKSRGGESTKEKKERAMQEVRIFRQKWAKEIAKGDPYYNPNLSYYSTDYQLDLE